jgi:hypothetical protein
MTWPPPAAMTLADVESGCVVSAICSGVTFAWSASVRTGLDRRTAGDRAERTPQPRDEVVEQAGRAGGRRARQLRVHSGVGPSTQRKPLAVRSSTRPAVVVNVSPLAIRERSTTRSRPMP